MQSASPTWRFAGAGYAWYCPGRPDGAACHGTLFDANAYGVRWCDDLDERHAWRKSPEGEWLLVGYAPYRSDPILLEEAHEAGSA